MNQSFYYDNAESLEKIRKDFAFLDSVKDPLKNPYNLTAQPSAEAEDVLTKGEREAYLIGNYAKRGYVPTREGYEAYELWRKQTEPSAWGTIWEAGKSAVSTVMGGAYDMVTSGDILNPLTVTGTLVEGGARGTRQFVNMIDSVKYDPTNPVHRVMFNQGTLEQRYADFQKGLEFQRETGEIEEAGYWVPKKEWDVEGWKIRSFNEKGVAATEMVLDPSIIMPELKIGSFLKGTAVGAHMADVAANVAVKGSKLAERAAINIETMAGKVASTSMGIFEYPSKKASEFLGIETLTTSNGKVIAKDSIVRSSTMGVAGTAYLAQIPYVSGVAGVWLGAKVTEIAGKTVAEALAHSRMPSYLTIADRLAYQSTDPAVRAIGGIAMRTNGFIDWASQGVKSTFHGSMYGGAFGFALGGEEGFYSGVGTGIGLAGSFHMLGGAYGIVGNRKERQIANAQKHFAYVAEGFDDAKRHGVNTLLRNIEDVYGEDKMFRTMANIAATERMNKNGKNLILTTEQIRNLLGNSPEWSEYQKLMKDPQFGGYTTRRSDNGQIITIINADYAAHSAVTGELFHSALLQRYGQGMKEHLVKSILGTADSDGFLYKLSPQSRIKMLEDFKRAYLELDDTAGGGAQRSMLDGFNDAIAKVKRGEKPETLYPIFEEFAEAYFNRWVEDKPIDYLLKGSSPWEAVLDGAKKMVRGLMDGDVEQVGGRIQFKSGEPEGFFLDGNGRRVAVPEMDKVMRMLVREMKKDPDSLEGFPLRDDANPNHILLSDSEHLFKAGENGRTVRKTEAELEREWSRGITGLMNAHAKLKPEERGLRFVERKVVETEDVEGSFAPKSKKAAEIEKEAKRLEKITKQRQAKLLREAARVAKLSEKEQRKIAKEADLGLYDEVEDLKARSQEYGTVEYKIEGYMTDAEAKLFAEYLPKSVANKMTAFNRVIHNKGADGNNVLRFEYESKEAQNFSYTTEGRPTGEGNTRYNGRTKTRDIIPYEMILKFERQRLTKALREEFGIDDPDAAYAAIKPVLLVNGIDMKALDRRVRYAYNHMRRKDTTSSISSAVVKMYYDSEEEIHHDIKRLLGNYSLGDIAMAGADFFGGGADGRAKRDIINGIIGARPVRVSPETMQKKGYHYPLDLQRPMTKHGGGPLNEAFMVFTSFRVDRVREKPRHLQGEGFYYDHEHAHPLNKGNFQPVSKALRDHAGRALSYSERQLQEETTFKSPSGEPYRLFVSNSEGGVHYAWFDETRARENHGEVSEGYITLRGNEVLDLLNETKVQSIKDLNKDFLDKVADMGYKAIVVRTTDGDRVVAFTNFNKFKQTDVSAFDAVMGNFSPKSKTLAERTRERLGLTGATPTESEAGKPLSMAERTRARVGIPMSPVEILAERTFGTPVKAEPIKIDVATDIVVGSERTLSPEQMAKIEKSLGRRRELLAERGLFGEARAEVENSRRKMAEWISKTPEFKGWTEAQVYDSMFTSIWGKDAQISLTKGGKVSLGVIQSLSISEYMDYRRNGVLPSDIKQRTIADIDMALMENWKRRHALQQSLIKLRADKTAFYKDKRAKEAKYDDELNVLRNELVQMLASYKLFDVADEVLGGVAPKQTKFIPVSEMVSAEEAGWTPPKALSYEKTFEPFIKSQDNKNSYLLFEALYPRLGQDKMVTIADLMADPKLNEIRKWMTPEAYKHVLDEFNRYNLEDHKKWQADKESTLAQYTKEKERLDDEIKRVESHTKRRDTSEARARSAELAAKIRDLIPSKNPIIDEWSSEAVFESIIHDLVQLEPEQRKARMQELEKTGVQIEKGNQGTLVSEEQFTELRERTKRVYTSVNLNDPNAPQTENVQYGFSAETPVHNVGEYYVAKVNSGFAIYKKPQYDKDATLRGKAVGVFPNLKEAQLRIKEIRNNNANVSFDKKTSKWVVRFRDAEMNNKAFGPVQDEIDSAVQKQRAEEYAKKTTDEDYPEFKGEIVEPSTDKQTAIEWPVVQERLRQVGLLPPSKMEKHSVKKVQVAEEDKRIAGGDREKYRDAMDEAFRVLQAAMRKDKTITPLQRSVILMQSVARNYKKNGNNPAMKERLKQLESMFKETERLTDFNLKQAYKKMLGYGFVSMNWAGDDARVVLDATGHYVERVTPPRKQIGLDFEKLRMPKAWKGKAERVVLTTTDGVKVSNNEMAKALRDMRARFGEALADQSDDQIIELAKTAGKGMLLAEAGADKQTDLYLTGEARTIRRWAAFEERKDNTFEETESRIIYVENVPKYILAKGSKSQEVMVIPFREATYSKEKNTYYWSRDKKLNESSKARAYPNLDTFLETEGAQFKAMRELTLGDTSDRFAAYKPNGWHINNAYFKTQEEAKRAAVIDAEENHSYEAIYKTAKRLDKDAYTSVLQMIQNYTGIDYEHALAEAIGYRGTRKKDIDNPNYREDIPTSKNNPRKIRVEEDYQGSIAAPEFKKLAIYRAGNLLLVTSDNRKDVLTRLGPDSKVSVKGGRTKNIEKISREAIGQYNQGKKVLGDLYRITKDENGNMAGIEWVTHYDNPKQVSEMLTKLNDPSFVDLDTSVDFHRRMTKEMRGVLTAVHKEEKKKIFKVLTENPKKIREVMAKIRATEEAFDAQVESAGIIFNNKANRSARQNFLQRKIQGLTDETAAINLEIEKKLHWIANKGGGLQRKAIIERLVGEDKYYDNEDALLRHERDLQLPPSQQEKSLQIEYEELNPADFRQKLEQTLQEIEQMMPEYMRKSKTMGLLEEVRDGDYGPEHEQLHRELSFLKSQLLAAKGGKDKALAGIAKYKISEKGGAGQWVGPKEQEKMDKDLARWDKEYPVKAEDVPLGTIERLAEGTEGLSQPKEIVHIPRYLPAEGETFVSSREYMERFNMLISDIVEAHKKFGDPSSLDKLSLRKILETDEALLPLKEGDSPVARTDALEAMKSNIRNIEEYFDRTNLTKEEKDFKGAVELYVESQRQHILEVSENRIKAAVLAELDGRKDSIVEANRLNRILAEKNQKYLDARLARVDEMFKFIPEEQKPATMAYLERMKKELEVFQASELERVAAERETIREVAGEYALTEGEGRIGQYLAKWQEFGIKGDPLAHVDKVAPDASRIFPSIFSEFYPTKQDYSSATKFTKWEARATDESVTSETTKTGTRAGLNIGGFTTTSPIIAEIVRGEMTRDKFLSMRGLRMIDLFGAALSKKNFVESQMARAGRDTAIQIDSEGYSLLQQFFPDIIENIKFDIKKEFGYEDSVAKDGFAKREREARAKAKMSIDGTMLNKAFDIFLGELAVKQPVIEHAIAVVSGKERLAELTSAENLTASGKIDLTKLMVEELDMAFNLLGKAQIPNEKRFMSVDELVNNPLYRDAMLVGYAERPIGNLQSIFGDDFVKAATFLSLKGPEKRKMINEIITQIGETEKKIKADNKKTVEDSITTEWKIKELEKISKDKLEAAKHLLLELAQTDVAVKAYKGQVEQFWESRPQARTNILSIDDSLKLLSPNMEYGKAVIGADGKTVDVPVANPNDALFRTANGMFHAFKQGGSYRLFFSGHKSDDGLVNLSPSHIMTAPDLQRLQVAVRMFHDDVMRVSAMARAAKSTVDIKPSDISSFSRSFFDTYGSQLAPDLVKSLEANLATIGNYPDTTWIANPETGNKRQIIIYPNSQTWNKLHDSGEYIFSKGTWYKDPSVRQAQERLDRARLEHEQLNVVPVAVAETKPSEVLKDTASHTGHDQPTARSERAKSIDNKTTMEVLEEGGIFTGTSEEAVMQDWTAVRNKEGWIVIREQNRTLKGWTTKFKTFFPSGVLAGLDDTEEDAVARMFQ